jgi:peptidylprolyl isomerase
MRRSTTIALATLTALTLAACGSTTAKSSSDTKGSATTTPATDGSGTGTADTAGTGVSDVAKPKVVAPKTAPTSLVITDLTPGTGPKAALGDLVVVNYVGVRQADGSEFDNSYDRGQPFEVPLGQSKVIKGWDQGLVGVQAGARRQLDIPASLAYGDAGAGEKIKPGDALSFVIDVVAVLPGSKISDQPDVTVKSSAAVTTISKQDLVVGTGATPEVGKRIAVRIMLFRADNAQLVTSTWGTSPIVFDFGPGANTFPGILAVADGMKVGGRRLAQLPFSQMFDGKGNATLKMPAGVDMFLVMDLVAVY